MSLGRQGQEMKIPHTQPFLGPEEGGSQDGTKANCLAPVLKVANHPSIPSCVPRQKEPTSWATLAQSTPHSLAVSPQARRDLEMRCLSYTGPATVSGGEGVSSSHSSCRDVRLSLHCPLALAARDLPPAQGGAAASGMGDSTSLPAGFGAAAEAQVCEGSAGLLLAAEEAGVAEAWAARSR